MLTKSKIRAFKRCAAVVLAVIIASGLFDGLGGIDGFGGLGGISGIGGFDEFGTIGAIGAISAAAAAPAEPQPFGMLREHAPIAAIAPVAKANVISSEWIELYLPFEDGFNQSAVMELNNYTISSVFDDNFRPPVTPAAINYRYSSEEAPYTDYTNMDYGIKDIMKFETIYRIYLQLPAGSKLKEGCTYNIAVSPDVGVGIAYTAAFDISWKNAAFHVNQESYLETGAKVAYLSWWTGDTAGAPGKGQGSVNFDAYPSFYLINEATGLSVFEGPVALELRGITDRWGKADSYTMDFTSYTIPGSYHLYIPGVGISYSFKIGNQDFRDSIGYTVFRGLLMQRDGPAGMNGINGDGPVPNLGANFTPPAFTDNGLSNPRYTHWNRPDAHRDDAIDQNSGTRIDLLGGHMDAGDRGKYPNNITAVSASLLAGATLFPDQVEAFGDDLDLPESGDGIPDYLNEIVFEMDLLYKMVMNSSKDGALPEYIRPSNGGYEMLDPVEGQTGRILFNGAGEGVFRSQTLYAAGALAMAFNTPLMQQHFPQRCADYLVAAKRAFNAFEIHNDNPAFWGDGNGSDSISDDLVGSGVVKIWTDEMLIAAAQLLQATGEQKYADWIDAEWPKTSLNNVKHWGFSIDPSWMNAFLSLHLCNDPKLDPAKKAEGSAALVSWVDSMYSGRWDMTHGMPIWDEYAGIYVGWHFSGDSVGYPLMMAYGITGDVKYLKTLQDTWNFLIGTNPTSRSFISNLGDPVSRPHWLVHEISFGEVQKYIASGGAQGWADIAPGIPAADVQNFRFKSQWGAAFGTKWNRDKEAMGYYPAANESSSNLGVDYVNHAALWLYQDAWNVDNEFIIGNIARQTAGILPLLGTYADGARKSGLSLSQNGEYVFEASVNYTSVAPVAINVRNTGFTDLTSLEVELADGADFAITTDAAGSLAKDAATLFAIAPNAGLGLGEYTDTIIVTGDGPGGVATKTLDVVFRVFENVTGAELYDGTALLTGGSYEFFSLGLGYSAADTLTVNVVNTGTGDLTSLEVSTVGQDAQAFGLTQLAGSIVAGGSGTFTVVPATGLAIGIYKTTVVLTGDDNLDLRFDVSFEVKSSAPAIALFAGGAAIGDGGSLPFKSVGINYAPVPIDITIENSGVGAVTGLAASSSNADFVVAQPVQTTIEDRQSTTFTIKPATALNVGTYTAAIDVVAADGVSVSFDVSINIYPYKIDGIGSPEYDVTITDDASGQVIDIYDADGGLYNWYSDDMFTFVYQDNLDGDQEIIAKLVDKSFVGTNGMAGIMLRPSIGRQEPYYYLTIRGGDWWSDIPTGNELIVMSRPAANGTPTYFYRGSDNGRSGYFNQSLWMRLVVSGGIVSTYVSSDGIDWGTAVDTRTLSFVGGSYAAGLAVAGQLYGGAPMPTNARFTNVSLGSPAVPDSYDLTIAPYENGAVVSDRTSPVQEGARVTLTVTPDAGYYLAKLSGRYESGSGSGSGSESGAILSITKESDTIYSFEMPAGNVTITAVFYPDGYVDPDALKSIDIGTCTYGRTDEDNEIVTVTSSSASGLGMAPDDLRYVYRDNLTGDMTLIANVQVLDQALMPGYEGQLPGESFGGLMIRQNAVDIPGASRYISNWLGVFLVGNNITAQYVFDGQQYRADIGSVSGVGRIQWLKLVKDGDDYSIYYSANGANWTQIGATRTLAGFMSAPYTMGFATGSSVQWNGYDGCISVIYSGIDWVADSVVPTYYDIIVDNDIPNGTISASKTSAQAGEVINLSAYPDYGYVFGGFAVVQGTTPVEVAGTGIIGSFIMPAGDVTITASFVPYVDPGYPMKIKDIGDCGDVFAFTDDNGEYSLKSTSRGSMTYGADNFTYGYKDNLNGDQTMIARVDELIHNSGDSKAGIMFRQDEYGFDESGVYSRWYAIFLSGDNTIWGIAKGGEGGSYFNNSPATPAQKPVWLKIEKTGDVLSAYYSFDAVASSASAVADWVLVNSQTFVFTEPYTMGVFVNGFAWNTTFFPATAVFSHVSWGGGPEIVYHEVGFRAYDGAGGSGGTVGGIGYTQLVQDGSSIDWSEVEQEYPFYNGNTWGDIEAWLDDATGAPIENLDMPIIGDMVLVPKLYPANTALVSINGPASAPSGAGTTVCYTISAVRSPLVSGIELEFEVDSDYLSSNSFEALGDFIFLGAGNYGTPVYWKSAGNIWTGKVTLIDMIGAAGGSGGSGSGSSGDIDIMDLVFNVVEGALGPTSVKLNYVKLSYSNGGTVASEIIKGEAITILEKYYSPYDLNKDGVVDLNDLTYALQYLMITEDDPEWNVAEAIDFSGNGIIDIDDLILILANYTIPYYVL